MQPSCGVSDCQGIALKRSPQQFEIGTVWTSFARIGGATAAAAAKGSLVNGGGPQGRFKTEGARDDRLGVR
eukprot:293811-Chlamydomonas_euryale.AAC.6